MGKTTTENPKTSFNELLDKHSFELSDVSAMDELMKKIGDSKYVLLGEASHGTHEYYTWRSRITTRLIEEKGFSFVAVEGDWPDCYRLNRYIKGYPGSGKDPFEVLHSFNRWPTWMWANWEIVALAEWLHKNNEALPLNKRVGFYGLDVYSLIESFDAIIKYLEKNDPIAKTAAIKAWKCFEPYNEGEGQAYGNATLFVPTLCEEAVLYLLTKIRKNMDTYDTDPEGAINAEQNAKVIVNAERYYRAMMRPGPLSWNLRDDHMVDTIDSLMKYHGKNAKCVVWEHNTHIGDARATDMSRYGMHNVGQLLREKFAQQGVYTVGFGSYKGSVIAGRGWGELMQEMDVPPAVPLSWEYVLHRQSPKDRIIFMDEEVQRVIGEENFNHRAIGVVYDPEYEYPGNYVPSKIPHRYDAFIFLDETTALHPLHIKPDGHQAPATFPFGL
jgi:erythromycin esterase